MPHFRRRRPLRRLLLWCMALALFAVLWKLFWWQVPPRTAAHRPALFALQAQVLLRAHLAARPVEGTLPPPERGTSAEAQLRLMGLWDGRAWTGKAAGLGRVEGRVLKVRAGQLVPGAVSGISAAREEDGIPTCRIEYRLRWDWPDQDRELARVAPIIGFRAAAPAGFAAPGQEAVRQLVVRREGWSWTPRLEPGTRPAEGTEARLWSALAALL